IRGNAAHTPHAVRRHAHRRRGHRRRPHLFPRSCSGTARGGSALMSTTTVTPQRPVEGRRRIQGGLLDPTLLWTSLPDALKKLNPATLYKNPVMFIVELGAVFTTVIAVADPSVFAWLIVVWLWLTTVFANLAEAVAEGRGKAQAESLRRARKETVARRL